MNQQDKGAVPRGKGTRNWRRPSLKLQRKPHNNKRITRKKFRGQQNR
jgi:hypothetical protein